MKLIPLSQIADIAMGSAPPSDRYNEIGDGIPMIAGAGDFGDVHPAPKKWTTEVTRLAVSGDLIVCVRATVGDLNWADREYCLGRGVAGIRAKNNQADIRYIARVLEAKKVELSRLGTGSTFLAIRKADLESFDIPVPDDIAEQRKIAAVLDKADDLRRLRRESLQVSEELLHAIFVEMFGTEGVPSCPRVRLSDHLDFVTSGGRGWAQYYTPEGAKFIRSLDVQMNEIDDAQMIRVTPPLGAEADRTRVRAGDVLLTITGSLIGRVAPVTEDHAGAFVSQHVAILRTHGFQSDFLSWAISTQEGQRQIQNNQTGQTKPGLNFEQIGRLRIPRPTEELENTFCKLISGRRRILGQQRNALRDANELFASLQQRAFGGELDLSRLVLDPSADAFAKPEQPTLSDHRIQKERSVLAIMTPAHMEDTFKQMDEQLKRDGSIPWSADYFMYRILAAQPVPFSFQDVMQQAERSFEDTPYQDVKEIVFGLLRGGERPAILRQFFDMDIDGAGRKEIVFGPAI